MDTQPSRFQIVSTNEGAIYSPLEGPRAIRLLVIHPGQYPDIVTCHLEVTDLDTAPAYEALSYAWGYFDPPDGVVCNGVRKSVTPNLGSALRRLRWTNRERVVWIDAICVNQNNVEERTQQVQLMKTIYSQTQRVIIWLGEDEDEQASSAIEVIGRAAEYYLEETSHIEILENGGLHHDISHESRKDRQKLHRDFPSPHHLVLPEYDRASTIAIQEAQLVETRESEACEKLWDAVTWFYSHPWFKRIWIMQEVAFGPGLIYVGDYEIDWYYAAVAAKWLIKKDYSRSPKDIQAYILAYEVFDVSSRLGSNILHLLSRQHSRATDPRDMVFALIGLSDQNAGHRYPYHANYSKNVIDVYIDTIRYAIEQREAWLPHLWRMSWLEPQLDASSDSSTTFPSWVIRWDTQKPEQHFRDLRYKMQQAWEDFSEVARITQNPNVLSMQGIRLQTVAATTDILYRTYDHPRVSRRVHKHWALLRLWDWVWEMSLRFRGEEPDQEAFMRTIFSGGSNTPQVYDMDVLTNYFSWSAANYDFDPWAYFPEESPNPTNPYIVGPIEMASPVRVFDFLAEVYKLNYFVTEDGHMGLGSKITRPGDILCVFFNHRYPYLIRPKGKYYRFLGPCYVDDIMQGEVMEELKAGRYQEETIQLC